MRGHAIVEDQNYVVNSCDENEMNDIEFGTCEIPSETFV
jgi:hypothetical protein